MDLAQFEVIAELLRSREPAKTAARMVLIDGLSNQEAAARTKMSAQAISNALTRYRTAHSKIQKAFCTP